MGNGNKEDEDGVRIRQEIVRPNDPSDRSLSALYC